MYQMLLSLILALLGLVLIFAPEFIIEKDSENTFAKLLADYHKIVGILMLILAYYFFPSSQSETPSEMTTESSSEPPSPSMTEPAELPSYEEATTTSEK